MGPYVITAISNNGSTRDHKHKVTDALNIHNTILYRKLILLYYEELLQTQVYTAVRSAKIIS